jgi:hypothetical protein
VIVLVIDEDGVFIFELEREPPIAIHFDRPMASHIAFQSMQIPSGDVHSRRIIRGIQYAELDSEFLLVRRLNPSLAAGEKELFKTGVPE